MNRRDKQTDCRQQRNNTWRPPPRRMDTAQGVSQIVQKQFRGENFDTELKNEVFPTNLSPDEVPPPRYTQPPRPCAKPPPPPVTIASQTSRHTLLTTNTALRKTTIRQGQPCFDGAIMAQERAAGAGQGGGGEC